MLSTKDRENLEIFQRKGYITQKKKKKKKVISTPKVLPETLLAKRKEHFQSAKRKKPSTLYLMKLSFKIVGKKNTHTFSNKELRKFINGKSEVQEMLKEIRQKKEL